MKSFLSLALSGLLLTNGIAIQASEPAQNERCQPGITTKIKNFCTRNKSAIKGIGAMLGIASISLALTALVLDYKHLNDDSRALKIGNFFVESFVKDQQALEDFLSFTSTELFNQYKVAINNASGEALEQINLAYAQQALTNNNGRTLIGWIIEGFFKPNIKDGIGAVIEKYKTTDLYFERRQRDLTTIKLFLGSCLAYLSGAAVMKLVQEENQTTQA